MSLPKLYKDGNKWVMEVSSPFGQLKLSPSQYEITLWKELHPEENSHE